MLLQFDLIGRIGLTFLMGAVLGLERESSHRPAGLRTHMLVAAGAAAFTIASTYRFVGQGTVRDPARVAAQIVVGLGFLGARTIWRTPNAVRGLTTAASVWVVAAVGVLAGSGSYRIAVGLTLAAFGVLRWARPPSRRRGHLGEPSITSKESARGEPHGARLA
jgi:putative Mg2+ transporter-C (MgtC) family protein